MAEMASNNTPVDVLTEDDWETLYGLGKFDTIAAEKLHAWTLDSGQDEECGNSTDWHWWAALFKDELAIVEEVSSGAVTAIRYPSQAELMAAWGERETAYTEYVHSGCKDGTECEGCNSCENA